MGNSKPSWKTVHKFEAIVLRDGRRDNLHISWDDEDGFVFLFTPDMDNTDNHYHIELAEAEALKLATFLEKKLFEIRSGRGSRDRALEILQMAPDGEPDIEDRL